MLLEFFSRNGNTYIIQHVLKKGYDPYTTDALLYALIRKHYKIIKLLLKYGADSNISGNRAVYYNPLQLAQSDDSAMSIFMKKSMSIFMHKKFIKINKDIIRESIYYV
jgi:hypothetical protein